MVKADAAPNMHVAEIDPIGTTTRRKIAKTIMNISSVNKLSNGGNDVIARFCCSEDICLILWLSWGLALERIRPIASALVPPAQGAFGVMLPLPVFY